ncbi:PASTA domain-containing protein [Kribbella sp. VKM Ac-2569]|uniref:PASTA domain-containing protein n=1 Tax=Kribbella sp. VKM Ac-2569 TaxID=2512220 RepID=UPI00102CD550|nr:PASTA domain-containing protein [Kribbella sp. VKM Ac-2569]RZT20424.1 PASTA domain-containing protein [Kribbella sp. VKM Ac-2569]
MNEPKLLDRTGGAGTPRRLRDRLVTAAAAATVVAVIGVTNVLTAPGGSGTGPLPGPEPDPVPMRLVGFGHGAIAVPKVWGTDVSRCGTPRRDTVLIDDPGAVSYCDLPRPPDVDSVELAAAPPVGFQVDETFTVDGVRAERRRTTCASDGVCWGGVGLPTLQVWFRASSSTSADEVDRILARIAIVRNQVGVPSFRSLDESRSGTAYAKLLQQLGLRAEFRTRTSLVYKPGRVVSISPSPGTLLRPGDTVTLTVIK